MTADNNSNFWPLVFVQLVSAGLVLGLIAFVDKPWDPQRVAGAVLAVISLLFLAVSRYQLGKSFSVTPQAKALVTHGIYSRIRNPIYIFSALMIAGLILVLHRPKLWFFLVILIPVQMFRARQEARVLEERFGDQYREYRRQTWF